MLRSVFIGERARPRVQLWASPPRNQMIFSLTQHEKRQFLIPQGNGSRRLSNRLLCRIRRLSTALDRAVSTPQAGKISCKFEEYARSHFSEREQR